MNEPDDKLWRRSKFRGEGWVSTEDNPTTEAVGTFWEIRRTAPSPGAAPPEWMITLYRGEQEIQLRLTLPMEDDSYQPDPAGLYEATFNPGLAKELGILQTYLPEGSCVPILALRRRAPGEWKAEE